MEHVKVSAIAWGCLLLAASQPLFGEERKHTLEPRHFLFSPEMVADRDGTIRLAHSVLVRDEMGATDHHQAVTLSDRVWATKAFLLSDKSIRDPELFVFGAPKQIDVNGKPLPNLDRLASTGWTRARVPLEFLEHTAYTVVMRGGGQLLYEPSRRPWRSDKSTDGGETWSHELAPNGNHTGEFLVRLRLKSYDSLIRTDGWALSPVMDLWSLQPGGIATQGRTLIFKGLANVMAPQPKKSAIRPFLRTGSTPAFDDTTWTPWKWLLEDFKPDEPASRHRWAQLRFELTAGESHDTPRLPPKFEFVFDFQPDARTNNDTLRIVRPAKEQSIAISSVPFVYQEPSPRLKLLRERYQLDKVVAPGKTEMEQLMLLRHWVRNQWHTAWGNHPAAWMPPWDTLIILESKDQPDCLTMCTHYAAVFTQCCLALGWNARHCILDHHCVAEVWVDQHQKWVMMDAGNSAERADVGLHFERNGLPLSALELHLAHRSGKTDDIKVCFTPAKLMEQIAPLCRPAPPAKGKAPPRPDIIPLADLPNYPVCQLNNYRRYAFPGRNNYLTSLYPGELYQGWSEYFYDGYWWVGDSPDDPQLSPEYSRHLPPSRPQDIDWSLNWTRIHLCRTKEAGELQVDLETHTPNLARLEKVTETLDPASKDLWQPTAANFVWKLRPGKKVLRARSVNHWGRAGNESRVELEWTPAKR